MIRRPGPPWIERDQAPGGIVLHIYTTDSPPRLLFTRHLIYDVTDLEAAAKHEADLVRRMIAANTPVVLVTYDGDTGERMVPSGIVPLPD